MTETDNARNVWRFRGGRSGEYEAQSRTLGIALLGFQEVHDLTSAETLEAVRRIVEQSFPNATPQQIGSRTGIVGRFRLDMAESDVILMPLKRNPDHVAFGIVKGTYEFREIDGANRHTLRVEWDTETISKDLFGDDIIFWLQRRSTVGLVRVADAYGRVNSVRQGKSDPGVVGGETTRGVAADEESSLPVDRDEEILDHIRQRFRGHDFAELVDAVLRADGYRTVLSPPGPDRGVDILAGRGPLGFDPPRLCVQVKATERPIGVGDLDQLNGVLEKHATDQGLFVSWSGFTKPAEDQARLSHFRIRLWTGRDLLYEIYRVYDDLPVDIRAKLPLQQVWTLVPDDDL